MWEYDKIHKIDPSKSDFVIFEAEFTYEPNNYKIKKREHIGPQMVTYISVDSSTFELSIVNDEYCYEDKLFWYSGGGYHYSSSIKYNVDTLSNDLIVFNSSSESSEILVHEKFILTR